LSNKRVKIGLVYIRVVNAKKLNLKSLLIKTESLETTIKIAQSAKTKSV